MLFNQLSVYKIESIPEINPSEFEALLGQKPFAPTLSQQVESLGWQPLMHQSRSWAVDQAVLLQMRREQRNVPPAVIRDLADQRFAEQQHRPSRDELRQMKEAILLELLPQAFPTHQDSLMLIDHKHQQLWVDQSSEKRVSQVTGLLRETIEQYGGLKIVPLFGSEPLNALLSSWLLNGPPAGFELGDSAKLIDPREGGQITVSRLGLPDDNVLAHLRDGLSADQLELVYQDQIRFTLKSDGHLTKIKVLTEADDIPDMDSDDPAVRFDADLRLMTAQLRGLIHALKTAMAE